MEENRVLELQRETPVYDTVDVLVLGAGPAGWGAAISAAREGAKTLLVEGSSDIGGVAYYNIDDFTRIAKENNQKKLREAQAATSILEEYELQFEQWMVFQKSLPIMAKVRDNFMKVTEHKGVEKAFDHLFYWVRENNDPEDLDKPFEGFVL